MRRHDPQRVNRHAGAAEVRAEVRASAAAFYFFKSGHSLSDIGTAASW